MSEKSFISTEEAATQLRYSPQHVRRLIGSKKLQGQRVGGRWVVRERSVQEYLALKSNCALPLQSDSEDVVGSPELHRDLTSDLTVDDIMSGGEPSLEMKRVAKKLAWANGSVPEETVHQVFHGDAREMKELDGESVHLVVTSPPYFNLVTYEGEKGTGGQLGNLDDYGAFLAELAKVWKRCFDLLAPGGRMCIVVGDVCVSRRQAGRHFVLPLHADIAIRCQEIGFDYLTPIYWSKIANMATEVGGSARFLGKPYEPNGIIKNDVEYILLLRKPGRYRQPTNIQRALSLLEPEDHRRWFRSVWTDVRGESRKAGHPAPYPAEIARRLIKMFSFVGDTVLDPFWGTGSTTKAAAEAVRSSIGYEIEDHYITIGTNRLRAMEPVQVPFKLIV